MGRQIIKQPNGQYCIYSSVVDSVTCYHFARQDLIDELGRRASSGRESVTVHVDRVLAALDVGGKPYHQFTMNYEEMFEAVERVHGKAAADKLRGEMEAGTFEDEASEGITDV